MVRHKPKKRGEKRLELSGFRGMWLFAMFDLPVTTSKARKDYTRFRKALLKLGFTMMQYSVYARYCGSQERANVLLKRAETAVPPGGQVRFLPVTDHQFGMMKVFFGKKRAPTEKPPDQLSLF